jgi:hypothetical protein
MGLRRAGMETVNIVRRDKLIHQNKLAVFES